MFTSRLLTWIGEGAQVSQLGFIFMGGDDVYKHQARFGSFLRTMGPALKQLCIEQNSSTLEDAPPCELTYSANPRI